MPKSTLVPMEADCLSAWKAKIQTAEKALQIIKPGQRIFIGSGASVPQLLVKTLAKRLEELYDNEVIHLAI